MIGAVLFTWLQGAPFYRELHKAAVDRLPPGQGKTWLDVGCGPGLVARLAAARGYTATGIDADPAMIKAARRLAQRLGSNVVFEVGELAGLVDRKADVVSAASLLAVVDDKKGALRQLWNGVRPQGHLLIIEPTQEMNPANAAKLIAAGLPRKRIQGLRLWARVRANRATDPAVFDSIAAQNQFSLALLGGMVRAWFFEKALGE